jgi:hypothetical protein
MCTPLYLKTKSADVTSLDFPLSKYCFNMCSAPIQPSLDPFVLWGSFYLYIPSSCPPPNYSIDAHYNGTYKVISMTHC